MNYLSKPFSHKNPLIGLILGLREERGQFQFLKFLTESPTEKVIWIIWNPKLTLLLKLFLNKSRTKSLKIYKLLRKFKFENRSRNLNHF